MSIETNDYIRPQRESRKDTCGCCTYRDAIWVPSVFCPWRGFCAMLPFPKSWPKSIEYAPNPWETLRGSESYARSEIMGWICCSPLEGSGFYFNIGEFQEVFYHKKLFTKFDALALRWRKNSSLTSASSSLWDNEPKRSSLVSCNDLRGLVAEFEKKLLVNLQIAWYASVYRWSPGPQKEQSRNTACCTTIWYICSTHVLPLGASLSFNF